MKISDVHTTTLADLLQQIMHAFVSSDSSLILSNPFFEIKREDTEFVINNIKQHFLID